MRQVVDALDAEAVRIADDGDGHVLEAESPPARLAVEMDVTVIVNIAGGVTELITDAVTAVIDLMEQMVLIEEGQGAEYAGLVNGVNPVLQLGHSDGPVAVSQSLKHQQPVGRGLDSVL